MREFVPTAAQFADAIPFHLTLGERLEVCSLGRSLAKLLPELRAGTPVLEHFDVLRPLGLTPTWESLAALARKQLVLSQRGGPLRLRGLVLSSPGQRLLFVLASPIVASLADLQALGLSFRDLPAHDATPDSLLLLENREQALADSLDADQRELELSSDPRSAATQVEWVMHVLLVEDNPVNQRVAMRQLTKLGHTFELARNGLEALAALERRSFDVVLMDLQMPELDGLQTACELRRRGHSVPIIALTANAFIGDRDACFAAGMNDYLSKPVAIERLDRTLRSWVSREKRPEAAASRPLEPR